ncbi:MAG: multiheme c-type cytochrome, partial [Calditrichia bacterium]
MSRIIVFLIALSLIILIACEESKPGDSNNVINPPVDSLALIREALHLPESCLCHPNHLNEWKTSMHAYAFVDPIFFKLNDIALQRSNNGLDQFCIKCHSPFATLLGEAPPGFDPANLTPLAQRGIQCDVCHRIKDFERGRGVASFHLENVKRGPIADPAPNDFHQSEFDARYTQSFICTPCHDVLSPSGMRVEETSTEWDNSPYVAMGVECQNCHMPTYSGQAAEGGPFRNKLHRHYFVGVDIPLVPFPGRDNTIQMVDNLLKNTLTMTVDAPAQIS